MASFLLAAHGGCSRPKQDEPAPIGTSSIAAPKVRVLLDGVELRAVAAPVSSQRVAVAELMPAEARESRSWQGLRASSVDGRRRMDIAQFGERYGDQRAELFLDPQHGPSLGIFRAGSAEPHPSLLGVAEVEVVTQAPPAVRPNLPPLVLRFGAVERALRREDLAKLKVSFPPGVDPAKLSRGQARRTRSWHLRDVLRLVADSARVGRVTAKNEAGETLAFDDLDDPRRVPLLRQTSRGQLDVRVWGSGEIARLRGVTHIEANPG